MKRRLIKTNLWLLVVAFCLMLAMFFVPVVQELLSGPFILVVLAILFSLGLTLIVLALKTKVDKKTKKFLVLTGVSAAGILAFSVLHNFFYALGIITAHIKLLKYFFEFLHGVSFARPIKNPTGQAKRAIAKETP